MSVRIPPAALLASLAERVEAVAAAMGQPVDRDARQALAALQRAATSLRAAHGILEPR